MSDLPYSVMGASAIDYANRGLSVIPIKHKDKKPLIAWEQYQKQRASEGTIIEWFTKWRDANVGIVTGAISGLIVLDIDNEEARQKIKSLCDLSGVPISQTGKGWQLFFKHPSGTIPNRAAIIPGLDVRGDGGYVVAPPSIHPNGKQYKWKVPLNSHLPAIPDELLKLITASGSGSNGNRERFNAAEVLKGVPEGQRDEKLFKFACQLVSDHVRQDLAEELIRIAAANCQPPFDEKIALEKAARAYQRYEPRPQRPELRLQFMSMKELLALPPDPTRWLWDQTLPAAGFSVLVAKPKIGKSTFAANLAISIARGIPFLGRNTQQSPVAYLSLDASLPEMMDTFHAFGPRDSDPVFIHAGAAPKEAVAAIMQWVRDNDARFVIVDTIQRMFRFQNVADYSEVTNAIEPLTEAAREQKTHVMFLHHAGKYAADDLDSAIGSTAIRGLAYTYLHLKRLPNSERRILRSDQRGGKNIPEMAIGFDRATGWLHIEGTMEEAEIDEAKPAIADFLKNQDHEVTEKEIRYGVPLRTIIVSKALREMLKAGDVERTSEGKKRKPFRYCLAASLLNGSSENSRSGDGGMGEGGQGSRNEFFQKSVENTESILDPEKLGSSGIERDRESAELCEHEYVPSLCFTCSRKG